MPCLLRTLFACSGQKRFKCLQRTQLAAETLVSRWFLKRYCVIHEKLKERENLERTERFHQTQHILHVDEAVLVQVRLRQRHQIV